jgi:CheY-like chemotaxis protein
MLLRALGPMINIDADFPPDLPAIRVDPNLLELALLNLALNARDAMPEGGRLTIAAHRERVSAGGPHGLAEGMYVRIAVADTGSGMDEATLKRASEPFFTTKGAGKGSGLGLSMVQGFAMQSGGTMRIASGLGEGTIVDIWLPVDEGGWQPRPAFLVVPEPVTRPIRILVVDDDPLTLAGTAAMLEDLGHKVVEASSGARALELLRTGVSLDLVITDQGMPEMAGTDLARQIRDEWPGLPIVLATGYADLPRVENLELMRLSKPYLPRDLTALIAQVLHETSVADLAPLAQQDAPEA